MNDTDTLFKLLFGWGFVIIAVLLFMILIVALSSMFRFKKARRTEGKIIELTDIGEQNLPMIEYQTDGEKIRFKTKTSLRDLVVGQNIDVEVSSSNEARIFDANRSVHAPKVIFMIIFLFVIFSLKGFGFLQTFFG